MYIYLYDFVHVDLPSPQDPTSPSTCQLPNAVLNPPLSLSNSQCQDWFFTDLISTRGLGVRGWPSGKTEMLRSVVALPK